MAHGWEMEGPKIALSMPALIEVEANLQLEGVLQTGLARVTEQHILFLPTGGLGLAAPRQGRTLPVDRLDDLRFNEQHESLTLRSGGVEWGLFGRHLRYLHARLLPLIGTDTYFEVGEQVVLIAAVQASRPGTRPVQGELLLTDRQARFSPEGDGAEAWTIRLDDMDPPDPQSGADPLVVPFDGVPTALDGPIAQLLPSLFHDLIVLRAAGLAASDHGPAVLTSEAAMRRSFLSHPGALVLTRLAAHFIPIGRLDRALGARPHRIPLDRLTTFGPRGWPERWLELRSDKENLGVYLPATEHIAHALAARARCALDALAANAEHLTAWAAPCLSTWSDRLALLAAPPDQVLLIPALLRVDKTTHEVGLIRLSADQVAFLPRSPDSGAAFAHPTDSLVRISPDREPFDEIRMRPTGADERVLLPVGGPVAVSRFWARCHAPSRIIPWPSVGPHTRGRITSFARSVTIEPDGRRAVQVEPARALSHPRGWALVMPGTLADALPIGLHVEIRVGQPEGVYRFKSRLLEPEGIPLSMRVTDRALHHLLIAELPLRLRVYNRRDHLRVPVSASAIARRLESSAGSSDHPIGPTIQLSLDDLSIGGCSATADHPLPTGARVQIRLRLSERRMLLHAQVLRSGAVRDDGQWSIGLRFAQMNGGDQAGIYRHVVSAQRAALRDDGTG